MKLLVTGGAGYIGAHVVRLAEQAGHEVVVIDNFSTGLSQRVHCEVVNLQLASPDAQSELSALMQMHQFDAVIHLAARKQVGESVEIPEQYFLDNLGGLGNLLIAMRENDLHKLVFSSSAATYGIPDVETVSEDYPGKPINPYGQTKLIGEWMVANAAVWGLKGVNLRYFNVAGCEFPDLADTAELNLIPIAIGQLKRGDNPIVFGDDYPTPDGSCIRDYVHVGDLARAHLIAVDYLKNDDREFSTFNVGTGAGSSVLEVLAALKTASGIDFTPEIKPRRAGDPPSLVADTTRIQQVLGFKSHHGIQEIVQSAWDAASN